MARHERWPMQRSAATLDARALTLCALRRCCLHPIRSVIAA
jgi:hypothetical protein